MAAISNVELRLDAIPSPEADWDVIWDFALTFDGYEYWGSFEKCAEIANSERDLTLTDLRTCLFFEFQRWRHFGDDPDEEAAPYIRSLLNKIQGKVAMGALE